MVDAADAMRRCFSTRISTNPRVLLARKLLLEPILLRELTARANQRAQVMLLTNPDRGFEI